MASIDHQGGGARGRVAPRFEVELDASLDEATVPTDEPPATPVVTVREGVGISEHALAVLRQVLRAAGLASATVTSGRRSSEEQARVMFDLIARHGADFARRLYAAPGRKVVEVFVAGTAAGQSPEWIRDAMRKTIVALGPSTVSRHTSDDYDVFDVAPSSLARPDAFRQALQTAVGAGSIDKYLAPPVDPAFHVEIKLPRELTAVR